MEEERTLFDVVCDVGLATDSLKYLSTTGVLTEEQLKQFNDLKGVCIDFITAYEYYITESPNFEC